MDSRNTKTDERKDQHFEVYHKIKSLLGTPAFSFRIYGEKGNTRHVLRLTSNRAKTLGLSPLIDKASPLEVYEEIKKTFGTGTKKEVVSNA